MPIGSLVSFIHKNTWAEYTVVPKDELFILPADFPVEKAVQFALNPVTAWGLLQTANLNPGDFLLLSAGNSVVAKLITRFAILRHINVIAVVRDAAAAASLKIDGISVVDINEVNFVDRVLSLTNGKGANCALDPVGGTTGTRLMECLGLNGKLIIYGKLSPEPAQLYYPVIQYKNLTVSAFGVRGYIQGLTKTQRLEMVESLVRITGDPKFKMEIKGEFDITEYPDAIKAASAGTKDGKAIFVFNK